MNLDFMVIGAQKSGTTTLFHILRDHPGITLPADKEAPFFNDPMLVEKGLPWLLRNHFSHAHDGSVLGKITPHYMSHPGCAQRIAALLPEVRLIAILRDPVERAVSHHRMFVRRGMEPRSFDQAARDLLTPAALAKARSSTEETSTYIVWGEYGRVLSEYLTHFRRDQLLVLYTEDLEARPQGVVDRILDFIDLPPMVLPNVGKRFHVGGSKERLPGLRQALMRSGTAKRVWHLLPLRHRRLVHFKFDQWNIVTSPSEPGPSHATVAALRDHYAEDLARLSQIAGPVPWETEMDRT